MRGVLTMVVGLGALLVTWACAPEEDGRVREASSAVSAPAVPEAEYADRRARLLEALQDGITLVHARPAEKSEAEWGFVQAASFYYFTGLGDVTGAVLALDGPAGEAHLFLPPAPQSFGFSVEGLVPEPGPETAASMGLDGAHAWSVLEGWVESRLSGDVDAIYVDEPRRPEASGSRPWE